MLDIDKVVSLFSLFSDLEGGSLDRWVGFCKAGAARIQARLRPEIDAAADMEGLCAAAAAWAYCDYLTVGAGSGMSDELRVGDISVKNSVSGGDRDAEEIRDYFLSAVSHLLTPENAVLIAVGGESA